MSTRKPTAKQEVENDPRLVTYLCETQGSGYGNRGNNDTFQFQVPEHWEVTFSYVNPGEAKGTHCVRVYEPMPAGLAKKLRAVYADVVSIRDLDIPHAVKVVETHSKAEYEQDSVGNFNSKVERKVLDARWEQDEADQPF